MVTSIQITALDGIVNVNSLFTFAVFVGLAWNPTSPSDTLITDPACTAGRGVGEALISFHVYSFSCFLFSSLVALALKQAIRINNPFHLPAEFLGQVNKNLLRIGMLISGIGSAFGCVFLMLALVNVVQLKLGTLSCGSSHTYAAVVPLVIFVPVAILIYSSLVLYAFTR
ncbi:unnamed protein product [Linum tenue]|uniref:Maternal effect embryo arrest 60 n=1 Tax=Linum tenue TaxID=586396 RepID=A0AAV0JMW1_9ROSI|nr:unnamed protein product [Linum tenue]